MNNKKLGSNFEKEFCEHLMDKGYWVHFITPNKAGAQPFDVIAVKAGRALAIDCKTSAKPIFPFSRLEQNQIYAFEKWLDCGNDEPMIAVKYNEHIYMVAYSKLKEDLKVDLREWRHL